MFKRFLHWLDIAFNFDEPICDVVSDARNAGLDSFDDCVDDVDAVVEDGSMNNVREENSSQACVWLAGDVLVQKLVI